MENTIKKTKVHKGYGEVLRRELDQYLDQIEGKELSDEELKSATDGFSRNFQSLSARVLSGAAITKAIQSVTEPEVQDTGKQTEIRFGDVALAASMIMVAFD